MVDSKPQDDVTQHIDTTKHEVDIKNHARTEGARTKASAGPAIQHGKLGGEWKFTKNPEFLK